MHKCTHVAQWVPARSGSGGDCSEDKIVRIGTCHYYDHYYCFVISLLFLFEMLMMTMTLLLMMMMIIMIMLIRPMKHTLLTVGVG